MTLRKIIKNNTKLTCAWYVFDNWLAGYRLKKGNLKTTSGSRHSGMSLEDSVNYIDKVFADYLDYGKIHNFYGTVAEIGPGDNFGVALCILNSGAQSVHAIDRWKPIKNLNEQKRIYQKLSHRVGFEKLFDGTPNEDNIQGLVYHQGVSAEQFFKQTNVKFDFIISRAVMEHLFDPLEALTSMANALKPGGMMIHRIDLRDHGMFSGHHPLTHLMINEKLWKIMTNKSGRPNRILAPHYKNWLNSNELSGDFFITRLTGITEEITPQKWEQIPYEMREESLKIVKSIKHKISSQYQNMKNSDLSIAGCVLIGKK